MKEPFFIVTRHMTDREWRKDLLMMVEDTANVHSYYA